MIECLKAAGSAQGPAEEQTDVMLEADRQGHFSHGMNRLGFHTINLRYNDKCLKCFDCEMFSAMYCNDIVSKSCDPSAKPVILKESAATAWVDGNNTLGAVVGNFCMKIAMKKAKESGVGWVVAKRYYFY